METTVDYTPWMSETPDSLFERRNLGIPGRVKRITIKCVAIIINKVMGNIFLITDNDEHVWSFKELRNGSGHRIDACVTQHVQLDLHFGEDGEILYATLIDSSTFMVLQSKSQL